MVWRMAQALLEAFPILCRPFLPLCQRPLPFRLWDGKAVGKADFIIDPAQHTYRILDVLELAVEF